MEKNKEEVTQATGGGAVPLVALRQVAALLVIASKDPDEFNNYCREALEAKMVAITEPTIHHFTVDKGSFFKRKAVSETYFIQYFARFSEQQAEGIKLLATNVTEIRLICESNVDKFNKEVQRAIDEGLGFKAETRQITVEKLNVRKQQEIVVGGLPEIKMVNGKLSFLIWAINFIEPKILTPANFLIN